MILLIQCLDPDGICRAWAYGSPEDAEDIRKLAAEHLAEYRAEKAMLRDPLAEAEYTILEESLAGA